jgi:hypothetical protein
MARLRTLLILLLCLAVPMASWASVVDASACPAHAHAQAHVRAHAAGAHGHQHGAEVALTHHHAGTHHACDGKSCQHQCACGCGMGACSSGFATLFSGQAASLLFAPDAAIAAPAAVRAFAARGTSPLRPPIS